MSCFIIKKFSTLLMSFATSLCSPAFFSFFFDVLFVYITCRLLLWPLVVMVMVTAPVAAVAADPLQ
jgi:hypothetical protein